MSQDIVTGERDVLLVVDIQNDFCPYGALAVPKGDEVVPVVAPRGLGKGGPVEHAHVVGHEPRVAAGLEQLVHEHPAEVAGASGDEHAGAPRARVVRRLAVHGAASTIAAARRKQAMP